MLAPSSTSASGTPWIRGAGDDRVAVRAGLRVADRGEHALLEHRGHRVLEALGLLVDLVPRDPEDVGEEALDQPVAADDRPRRARRRPVNEIVLSLARVM